MTSHTHTSDEFDDDVRRLPSDVETALQTAISELPDDVHVDDVLDCLCALLPPEVVEQHLQQLRQRFAVITGRPDWERFGLVDDCPQLAELEQGYDDPMTRAYGASGVISDAIKRHMRTCWHPYCVSEREA